METWLTYIIPVTGFVFVVMKENGDIRNKIGQKTKTTNLIHFESSRSITERETVEEILLQLAFC